MTSLWVVTNSYGPDHVCELREQAMEHAAEMAGDFPQLNPWNVTEYVPASELAAAKARIAQRDAQIAVYNIGGFADADALAERYLSVVNELAAAKAEHAIARARYDRAINILSAIHATLSPPHFKLDDGRVMEFKNAEIEHQMLHALSERIRAIPSEIAAIDAAIGSKG